MRLLKPLVPIVGVVLVCLPGRAAAQPGECSCTPEVSNARAIVSSTCAKIWSNNVCTLKESGVAAAQPARLEKWLQSVYSQVPEPHQKLSAGTWPFVTENDPASAARPIELTIFHS